eukprot:3659182-Pyramimonas_sp.AAC.1
MLQIASPARLPFRGLCRPRMILIGAEAPGRLHLTILPPMLITNPPPVTILLYGVMTVSRTGDYSSIPPL